MAYTDEQIRAYALQLHAKGADPAEIEQFVSAAKAEQDSNEPGFVQGMVQSVARPFIKAGQTLTAPFELAARTAQGVSEGRGLVESASAASDVVGGERDFGYFGKNKSIQSPQDLVGTGAELGSYLIGGGGAKAGFEGIKGSARFIPALLRSVGAGATSGALSLGGAELQSEEATPTSVAGMTALGAGGGAILAPVGVLGAKATGAVFNAAKNRIFPNAEKEITAAVTDAIKRGIQPPVQRTRTAKDTEQYYKKATEAFQDIASKRGQLNLTNEYGEVAGELPATVDQLTQAVDQGKKLVFEGYNTLKDVAGATGRELSTDGLVADLRALAQDEKLLRYNPAGARYAERLANDFERRGAFGLSEAQDEVQFLNEGLKRLYGATDVSSTNKLWIDKFIADRLRTGLDAVVEAETGQEYQALRNMYAAYKSIEKDANHRSAVLLRGAGASLPDFLNIQSVGDVVIGLASGQPAFVAKGVAEKALNNYYKYLNSPNAKIKSAFEVLGKYIKPEKKEQKAILGSIQRQMQRPTPPQLNPPTAIRLPGVDAPETPSGVLPVGEKAFRDIQPNYVADANTPKLSGAIEGEVISAPPAGGYSRGATVADGGGAAPVTQMTQSEIAKYLESKGISPATVSRIDNLIRENQGVMGITKNVESIVKQLKDISMKEKKDVIDRINTFIRKEKIAATIKKKSEKQAAGDATQNDGVLKPKRNPPKRSFDDGLVVAIKNTGEYRKEGGVTDRILSSTVMKKPDGTIALAVTPADKQRLFNNGYLSVGDLGSYADAAGYDDVGKFADDLISGNTMKKQASKAGEVDYNKLADEAWNAAQEKPGVKPNMSMEEFRKKYLDFTDDIPFAVTTGFTPEFDKDGNLVGFSPNPAGLAGGIVAGRILTKAMKGRVKAPMKAGVVDRNKSAQLLSKNVTDLADAEEFLDYARKGGKTDIVQEQRGNDLLKKYDPYYGPEDALGVRADAIEDLLDAANKLEAKKAGR